MYKYVLISTVYYIDEQNNELTARPPDHPEAQASQVSSNVWYCRWFILTQLVLHIGLFWQWLVSILADIGIRIFGPLNRNGYVKNNNFRKLFYTFEEKSVI